MAAIINMESYNLLFWKEPLEVTPCLKFGQLEQVFQSLVQSSFEYLQGWTFHSLSRLMFTYPLFFNSRVPYLHMIPVGDVGALDLHVSVLFYAVP